MSEFKQEFPTVSLYFFKKKDDQDTRRDPVSCEIVYSDSEVKAYLFSDRQIWVYYGHTQNTTSVEEDTQLVKLTIKKDSNNKPYMYIDFINTHVTESKVIKLPRIIQIINSITRIVDRSINKIMLQDDAHFYCNNKVEYAVKALYLRALEPERKISKLSIYQKYGFQPTKKTEIEGCLKVLRSIKCVDLISECKYIIQTLGSINYSTTSVYQIHVQNTDLQISYTPIKSQKIRLQPIFSSYRSNLTDLITLLEKDARDLNVSIYDFCKVENEDDDSCILRKKLISCLENNINMHVIIIKGELNGDQTYTECDVKIDQNESINITKTFNLFYGTFKKIGYLYNEMETSF
jgi:hypothetical protein